ncbi:RNA dependent RNA polymerase-domain-containing protein [Zopfochytrium polystomum]|nr:RNA dependent RNA polymerase-domain-containing protein [Zopfochytrium polystomum]
MHSVLKIIKLEDEKALRKVCSSAHNFQREEIASWRKKKRRGVSLLQGNNEFKGESDPERRLYLPLLNSRRLLGAADPIEVLQPSDCFVQVTQNDGTRLVVTGKVAVARNPCYHPGDILLLNAVDIQPLRYISDIVVFSSLGDRPAPDMSSGGDLDGDDFLLIWDPDIVAGLKDHEPFDYRPQRLEPLIRNIASKLGIQTRSAGGGSKTNLIKMLTQKADPDSIGRIDSLFLEFRKFEYRDDAGGVLTKEELQNLLVAMFSASVDRLGFDIGSLMTAVQQELWKCRTSNLTPEHEVLQKCVLSTDSAAEFILESNRDPELIFQFFRESLANDGSWKRDDFLATFRPPLRRENADVAVKMLNMAERLFADEPGALPQVPENVSDALNKIEKLREECSTSDIRRVYDSFKFQKQEEKHWNDILESSTDEEERRCARIQLKTIIDSIDELTHSTLLNDTRLVNEYKTTLEAWKAAVERLSSFVKILEIVANRLLTSNHVSRDVSECDAILSQELRIFSSILPIYDCRRKIAEFWSNESRVCLILSETGSGKSTCLPQFLANELYMKDLLTPSKPIIVAQPRRIATTSLARRLAEDRFTNVGDVIGAHIGKSKAVAKKHRTVIICTTYGILLSYARRDPLLRGFTCIILDEVHEDSTDLYFLFGIVQHAMKHNPLLKVFLMSAKVNSDMLCEFFKNCEIIKVKGRGFPIKEHFAEDKLTMDEKEYLDYAIQEASDIHQTTPLNENPDILVFLPKIGSINTACDQFEKKIRDYLSPDECLNFFQFALHSKVDEEDKRFILRRSEIEAERHEERRALVLGDFLPDSNVDSVRENTQVDTDERQESTGLPLDSADGATSSSLAMEEQSSSNGNTLPKADQ